MIDIITAYIPSINPVLYHLSNHLSTLVIISEYTNCSQFIRIAYFLINLFVLGFFFVSFLLFYFIILFFFFFACLFGVFSGLFVCVKLINLITLISSRNILFAISYYISSKFVWNKNYIKILDSYDISRKKMSNTTSVHAWALIIKPAVLRRTGIAYAYRHFSYF